MTANRLGGKHVWHGGASEVTSICQENRKDWSRKLAAENKWVENKRFYIHIITDRLFHFESIESVTAQRGAKTIFRKLITNTNINKTSCV